MTANLCEFPPMKKAAGDALASRKEKENASLASTAKTKPDSHKATIAEDNSVAILALKNAE